MEHHPDSPDQTLSDVVMAVSLASLTASREVEQVTHPHADLAGDPGAQPLERHGLQGRDVCGEGVGDHGEEGGPVTQLGHNLSLTLSVDRLAAIEIVRDQSLRNDYPPDDAQHLLNVPSLRIKRTRLGHL